MKRRLLGGAAVIAAGGLASKIIGALYRIPLTNIIGAEGIGLYQMVFPVYCALLTVSSTGIPTALSKLVSQDRDNGEAYFIRSVLAFGAIGLLGSAIMFVLGGIFAKLQGNANAAACYMALSPSVFLVSLISCVRGYFQGKSNMVPTAVSQIVEQVVKAVVGLAVCSWFKGNAVAGAVCATLAVTASEGVALLFLYIRLKAAGFKRKYIASEKGAYRKIFAIVAPVAVAAMAIPLGNVADSFIVINATSGFSENATAAFGIYSGSVAAIIGVPVSLAYGVAVALIPAVSSGSDERAIADSLRFTGFLSIPFAVFFAVFSRQVIDLLYGGMSQSERMLASTLLSLEAASVVLTSYLQTTNAILTARGRQRVPMLSMGIALVARVVLCAALSAIRAVGIYGAVAASVISQAVALAINVKTALGREGALRGLIDTWQPLIWSIICVLGGFFVCNAVGGRLVFVLVSLAVAAAYSVLPVFKILKVGAKRV